MIRSWRNSVTRKVWEGEWPNQLRGLDFEAAIDLLLALNVAKALSDLSPLKSVGLHKLKGERKNQWAMTVNARWRICFEFRKGDAYEVEIQTIIRDDNNASCHSSGPSAKTRIERALTERQSPGTRYRRAVGPYYGYFERPALDYRRH